MTPTKDWRTPTSLAPSPLLAGLRDAVLVRSHKRMPKWRFRLADDLIAEIQPVPPNTQHLLFRGLVVHGSQLTATAFRRREDRRGTLEMNFVITGDSDTSDKWAMRATGYGWPVSVTREDALTFVLETVPVALIRLAECTSLAPGQLLSSNCLICGKALTDPASMARLIGPECAGTVSLCVPWIVSLLETPGAA